MAAEEVGDIPMNDVCMAQPYYVGMLTSPALVQRDQFSVESIQYDGYCNEVVVMDFCGQKIKLWQSPVGPCLMSRSGTYQRKEPFWPCTRRFVDSPPLVRGRSLPRMWQEKVASASSAPGGLPMRKRKLRRVCAPESLQRTLQVASLPEVWASGVQRPALNASGWSLESPVGRGVLGIRPCFW